METELQYMIRFEQYEDEVWQCLRGNCTMDDIDPVFLQDCFDKNVSAEDCADELHLRSNGKCV